MATKHPFQLRSELSESDLQLLVSYEPGYYLTHEAVRKDLERFVSIEDSWNQLDDEAFAQIHDYFHFHVHALEGHHLTEDQVVFPMVLEENQDFKTEIDALEEEHEALVNRIDALSHLLHDGDLADVKQAMEDYAEFVNRHLVREEYVVVKMAKVLGKDFFDRLSKEVVKSFNPIDALQKLAWTLDAGNDEQKRSMFAKMPFFIKPLYRVVLKKRFEKQVRVFNQFRT